MRPTFSMPPLYWGYLPDRWFVHMLRRLRSRLRAGGRMVIGNFAASNPSRDYMEFGDWILIHRTADQLVRLGEQAGYSPQQLSVAREPMGVNLFLHISAPPPFT